MTRKTWGVSPLLFPEYVLELGAESSVSIALELIAPELLALRTQLQGRD
jgi:hypothetical protein